jgi:hypothetical protein
MERKFCSQIILVTLFAAIWSFGAESLAAPKRWKSLVPFAKRMEADPNQRYVLEETHGPWMILAASFSGEQGFQQAHNLTLDLRRSLNRPVYVHARMFDFSAPVAGIGLDKYNRPRQMRYKQDRQVNEMAVLVGDFDSPESPEIQKVLEKLKLLFPQSLDPRGREETSQRFVGIRNYYNKLSGDKTTAGNKSGPLSNAFVTRNPMLPEEYFTPKGVDTFVVKLNKRNRLSLLKNPGNYTVKIATFRGKSTMKLTEGDSIGTSTATLDSAAESADTLGAALRARNVEAWVLHDRFESVVTVGSFASIGSPRADGKIEMNPSVHQVIQTYRGREVNFGGTTGHQPRQFAGVACDIQPQAVLVPQQSATAEYARSPRLFR